MGKYTRYYDIGSINHIDREFEIGYNTTDDICIITKYGCCEENCGFGYCPPGINIYQGSYQQIQEFYKDDKSALYRINYLLNEYDDNLPKPNICIPDVRIDEYGSLHDITCTNCKKVLNESHNGFINHVKEHYYYYKLIDCSCGYMLLFDRQLLQKYNID